MIIDVRSTNLHLFVWLESHQTANLMSTGMQDAGAHKVVWVGIDAVQNPSTEAHQLQTQVNITV